MSEEFDQGEKTEEPSAHRIEEFRKRGEVASSKELNSVLVLSLSILTLALSLVYIYEVLSEFVEWLYYLDASKVFEKEMLAKVLSRSIGATLKSVGPVFIVSLCVGVIANVLQIGFLFSPEVLEIKLDRLNPINGVKKLFSMKSVVEAFKGVFKFLFILGIVYFFLKDEVNNFHGFLHTEFFESFLYGKTVLVKLGFSIIGGIGVIAIGDFTYQKISYRNKLRMTKEQAKKETKEKDGNPEIKQRIRTIQREMAQKRISAEVPNADVIVTNPTHISVALKYDPEKMISPIVLTKGADHLAMRIREIAKEHDIPIVENVPLARGLYKTVKEGHAVPGNMYKAVAEVLAFVYKLKRRKKAVG